MDRNCLVKFGTIFKQSLRIGPNCSQPLVSVWWRKDIRNSYSKTETPTKPSDKNSSKSGPAKAKTPIGRLDELDEGKHPYQEKEPLPPFPDNTNPVTGEIGGPRGPEPTRYGDWERKGRVTDF